MIDGREPPTEFDESAVLTLAELYYEAGFPPEYALDMAWETARGPLYAREERENDEW